MVSRLVRCVLVSASFLVACVGDDSATGGGNPTGDPTTEGADSTSTGAESTSDATTGQGTGGAGTGDTTAATGGGDTGVAATCDVPRNCEQLLWSCNPQSEGACDEQPYGPAFECAFAALALGEPAGLYLEFNGMLTGELDWIDIVVVGDGNGIYQYGIEDPSSFEHTLDPAQRCTLQPASWFESCMAPDVTPEQHAACMDPYAWFADDCVETSMCP